MFVNWLLPTNTVVVSDTNYAVILVLYNLLLICIVMSINLYVSIQ